MDLNRKLVHLEIILVVYAIPLLRELIAVSALWIIFLPVFYDVHKVLPDVTHLRLFVSPLLGFLRSIPDDILEAAAIDGATAKQTFWKIELPYLLPTVSMVFILALKSGLTAFDQIFALTGGGPNNATTSLGLLVYNYAFKSNQYGYANAIAIILFLIIGVVSVLQIKLSKKFEI